MQRQLAIRGLLVASRLGAGGAFPKKLLSRTVELERYLQAVSCGSPLIYGDSSHCVARGIDVPAIPPVVWLAVSQLRSERNCSIAISLENNRL